MICPSTARRNPTWPPPAAAWPVLRRLRATYHALPIPERPATTPTAILALLILLDLQALALAAYWPLPWRAVRWVTIPRLLPPCPSCRGQCTDPVVRTLLDALEPLGEAAPVDLPSAGKDHISAAVDQALARVVARVMHYRHRQQEAR